MSKKTTVPGKMLDTVVVLFAPLEECQSKIYLF